MFWILQELKIIRSKWNTLFRMSMSALKIVSLCSNNRQKVKIQTLSLKEQILYPYVYMDAPHLSEVCLNIISNAIKYTNTGGTISCNVLQESCEKEDWCNMIITITDNGIGMSEEFQKRIF